MANHRRARPVADLSEVVGQVYVADTIPWREAFWVRIIERPFYGGTLVEPQVIAPVALPRRAMLRRGKGRRR